MPMLINNPMLWSKCLYCICFSQSFNWNPLLILLTLYMKNYSIEYAKYFAKTLNLEHVIHHFTDGYVPSQQLKLAES